MKILRTEYLIKKGRFSKSNAYNDTLKTIYDAIDSVKWPDGSSAFIINPGKQSNGVKPIKERCVSFLRQNGWELEKPMNLGSRVLPGPIDAILNPNSAQITPSFFWKHRNNSLKTALF